MATEPIKLVEHRAPDNASAIELLTRVLEEAKTGVVTEVLIIAFREGGQFKIDASARKSNLVTIGALEFLKRDIIEAETE